MDILLVKQRIFPLKSFVLWLLLVSSVFGGELSVEAIKNPFFSHANYDYWTFSGAWRDDGNSDRLVFEISNKNVAGYPSAVTRAKSIVKALNLGENISQYRLSRITLNNPFLEVFNVESVGAGADYELFFEVDVLTPNGTYRAATRPLKNPWFRQAGEIDCELVWVTDDVFKGDIRGPLGRGISLDKVLRTTCKVVVFVKRPANNDDPCYLTLDNISMTFHVSIP